MDVNSLKVHIQQVTGHKNVESLNHYIDLAKAEITGIDQVIEKVNQSNDLELIEREKSRLLGELESGKITTEDYILKIRDLN